MLKAAMWVVAIGVLSVVAATMAASAVRPGNLVFAVMLVIAVALACALMALIVELTPRTGAAAGIFAALLLAILFAGTISLAPLAPGATRPGLRDLLWAPLFALLAMIAVCAAAGFLGVRGGLYLSRRRKGSGPAPRPMR